MTRAHPSTTLLVIVFSLVGGAACGPTGGGADGEKAAKFPEAPPSAPVTAGVVDAKGSVAIEVIPQYSRILADTKGDLNVLLKLDGKEVPSVKRRPLDLAIIIDRSGSMQGDKITAVKTAALTLLKRLNDSDWVTLISYSDEVRVHATRVRLDEAGRHSLRAHILGLQAGGLTALGPATFKALELIQPLGTDNEPERMSHIMLLSDGIANVGEARPTALGKRCAEGFARGVSLSTLGVGLDYNEDLMTQMADQGGGQYHFVREETMIAEVLDDELKGLTATVAREMVLKITPSHAVRIAKVYGYSTTMLGDDAMVKIGSLRSGRNRDVLVKLRVTSGYGPDLGIGDVRIDFKDTLSDNTLESITVRPRVKITADASEHTESENIEVTVRVAEVESAEELQVAAQAVDKGDFAQATNVIADAVTKLKAQAMATPDPALDEQIVELETAKKDIKEAQVSASARKAYVKAKKSSAYIQKKRTNSKSRVSAFDKAEKMRLKKEQKMKWKEEKMRRREEKMKAKAEKKGSPGDNAPVPGGLTL